MIYLIENTAAQKLYLTLKESVKNFTTTYTDYLLEFENAITGVKYYAVGVVGVDNNRYTSIDFDTTLTDVNNLKLEVGEYNYKVYGQNSATNLDPSNTVGVLEIGLLRVTSTTTHYDEYTPTINADIVYNG